MPSADKTASDRDGTADWIPEPGQVIAGRYRVEGLIGTGGMAAVVTAVQTDLGRRVAIKLLPPRAARSGSAVERFVREARAASAIDSDHVVKVFEVGRLANGMPFMVMEFLIGQTLARTIQQRGALPIQEGLDYVLQACVAVAQCHAIGLVHRDLKPENVMVLQQPGQRGHVKVLDFGISKADWFEAEHTPSLTGTSDVFGTPTHMSPEQVRSSKSVDSRTDIWALGVVLYEVLTGKPPFMAESLPALSAMIVSDEPTPPSLLRPDLPGELERAVLRCLAKRPQDRFASIQDLVVALAPFAAPVSAASIDRALAIAVARGAVITAPAARSGPYTPLGDTAAGGWGTTQQRRSRSRTLALGLGVGLGVFAASVVALLSFSRLREPAPLEPEEGVEGVAGPTSSIPTVSPSLASAAPSAGIATPIAAASADAGTVPRRPRPAKWTPKTSDPLDERH